jgi:hypothetical protein
MWGLQDVLSYAVWVQTQCVVPPDNGVDSFGDSHGGAPYLGQGAGLEEGRLIMHRLGACARLPLQKQLLHNTLHDFL